MGKYVLIYWLHNQSKEFSDPQLFDTNDESEFSWALKTAEECGYEIDFAGIVA